MFVILFCQFPKRRHLHKINDKNWTKAGLSKGEILIFDLKSEPSGFIKNA